jgi:hypothetical protein
MRTAIMSFDALAQPNTGVEPFLDDVAERAVDDQLNPNIRMGGEDRLELGPHDAVEGMVRQRQPDRSRGLVARGPQGRKLVGYLRDAGCDRLEQALAGVGRSDAARCAVQEADAHARLSLADRVAERRLRHAEPGGGPGEAALLGDGLKPCPLVQIRARHSIPFTD